MPKSFLLSVSLNLSIMDLVGTYHYQSLAALLFGAILFRQLRKGKNGNPNGLPLPPGPKGYPLVGNLFDIPVNKPWLVYDEWCKTYGDIVYFSALGQHFVVLNSLRRTTDLFEKRSANYSDRMRLPMTTDLMKCDFSMAVLPYGGLWRKHRKIFHNFFHVNAVSQYLPIQRRKIQAFLRRLLVTPDNFLHHTKYLVAATIIDIVYGIEVQEFDDPYISLVEESLKGFNEAAIPGAFWVDTLPILKYVPGWFPGAGFQKKAAYWRQVNASLTQNPFNYVKEQLKHGKPRLSMAATLIEGLPNEDDPKLSMEETIAQDVAAVTYAAGGDTVASTLQALFLAMALYPEVQKKAQAEIDAVVGSNRLPVIQDRPSLPYINAVVKELMRWHIVFGFGLPHMATNDDEYDGYYIPKGTVLLGNAWSILRDPNAFDNPNEYQPERYIKDGKLNPDVRDPHSAVFGFGRRICPGRHFGDNSLYLIASCLLAVYDIKPPVDDEGAPIKLKPEFDNGLLSYPVPFKCIIKPRTPLAETLIRGPVDRDN